MIDTIHLLSIFRVSHTVMTGSGYNSSLFHIFLQHRIVSRFDKRTKRGFGSGITNSIVLTSEIIGRIHHIKHISFFEDIRTFRPPTVHFTGSNRTALPFCLRIFICHRWTKYQDWFTDNATQIRFQFDAVDPAFFYFFKHSFPTRPTGYFTFYRMLIAASRIIQIKPSVGIFQQISVDNGITGIKKGTIAHLPKRAGRFIGNSYAYTKIFKLIGWIFFPVSAEKHIILPIPLIYFRSPEVSNGPGAGHITTINLAFFFPVYQIIR